LGGGKLGSFFIFTYLEVVYFLVFGVILRFLADLKWVRYLVLSSEF